MATSSVVDCIGKESFGEVFLIKDATTAELEPTLGEVWQAAYDGDLPRLRELVKSSIDPVLIDGLHETDTWMKRTTPTMAAACAGHNDVVRWIISKKMTNVDKRGVTLSGDGSRQIGEMTALLIACRQGHPSVVETLIESGRACVDAVNEEGTTCLMLAAFWGSCDVIRGLIRRGNRVGDRNNNGRTALHLAAEGGQVDAIELLIWKGAEVNAVDKEGVTCLMLASSCDVINDLIRRGNRVMDRDNSGNTPLHVAAQRGNVEAVKLLISEGAEVDAANKELFTPLHHAAGTGHPSSILILLQHGANIEARNCQQSTPLSVAAFYGQVSALKALIGKGADISSRGLQKMTLLHYAARRGQTAAIAFLIATGCDITATDELDRTPKAVAEAFNHSEAARLLDR